jgi:hypothetical protein
MGLISIPRQASAIDRVTDQDVKKLFEIIEHNRSDFEAALDDKLKNSTIKSERAVRSTRTSSSTTFTSHGISGAPFVESGRPISLASS